MLTENEDKRFSLKFSKTSHIVATAFAVSSLSPFLQEGLKFLKNIQKAVRKGIKARVFHN